MRRSNLYRWSMCRSFAVLTATLVLLLCFGSSALISVITKLQYKKATAHGAKQLKGLLGYLQHRKEAPEIGNLTRGGRRWIDRGAGGTSKEIQATCERLQSPHVFAFTWVINPNPDCMALVDPEDRNRFISELTEGSVEGMFEARGMPPPEYAYIKHNRETEDLTAPHRLNPHSHIILVGTYDDPIAGRHSYYMNKSQKKGEDHPDLFWKTAEAEMERLMERYVGRDWPDHLEALIAERERAAQAAQEQEVQARFAEIVHVVASATLQLADPVPDCWGEDDDGLLWRGWVTTRPHDPHHQEVGIHWQADDLLATPEDTFEILLADLDEDDARMRKQQLLEALEHDSGQPVDVLRQTAAGFYPQEPDLSVQEPSPGSDEADVSMDMDWSL